MLALGGVAFLSACAAQSPELLPTELAQQATLDALEFQALVDSPGTVVIDVRTSEEFAAGHLDGALNLDLESGAFEAELAELDREASYALYCRSGARSRAALDLMVAAGFERVAHLDGGIDAWTSAGLPTVK